MGLMLSVIAAALVHPLASGELEFDVLSRSGLSVSVNQLPIIQGSFFQYYESGWTKGYYSSNWSEQRITRNGNSIQLDFQSDDGLATGRHTYELEGNRLKIDFRFEWKGATPVRVENGIGLIWAAPFTTCSLIVDGANRTFPSAPVSQASEAARRIASNAKSLALTSGFGSLDCSSSFPLVLIDGRNYNQDWALPADRLFLGSSDLEVSKSKPLIGQVTLDLTVNARRVANPAEFEPKAVKLGVAQKAPRARPMVVAPQSVIETRRGTQVLYPIKISRPSALPDQVEEIVQREFRDRLARQWTAVPGGSRTIDLTATYVERLEEEEYELQIDMGRIEVRCKSPLGLAHALRTLAALVRSDGRRLVLPFVRVKDRPALGWRGAHFFIGPKSRPVHAELAQSLASEFKLNHVVLQAERTDWASYPKIRGPITTSRADARAIFDSYRQFLVDPVPLIQSFGHMEWFFHNSENLDLAFNPRIPYAIDPRKPGAIVALRKIWAEAIELFRPSALHFGLDEVSMRGFPDDPKLVSDLWERHLRDLGELASDANLPMMLWGDKGLAKGEAPDAALAETKEEAARRRRAIPVGSFVTDWHYLNNPDPNVYTSLDLWKKNGQKAIAAGWNRPLNIYGFIRAAIEKGSAGYLQTIWAGYALSMESLVNNFQQYGAVAMAAHYAWTGDKTLPENLPFDPNREAARSIFQQKWLHKDMPGWKLASSAIKLAGISDSKGTLAEQARYRLQPPLTARKVQIALTCENRFKEGEVIALLSIRTKAGALTLPIRYGFEVVTSGAKMGPYLADREDGWCLSEFMCPANAVSAIEIRQTQPAAGITIGSIKLIEG